MNIGERLRDVVSPETRELTVKQSRTPVISHLPGLPFSEPPPFAQVRNRVSSGATDGRAPSRLLLRPSRESLSSPLASSVRRRRLVGRLHLSLRRLRAPARPGSSRTILSFSPITRGRGKSSLQSTEARRIFVEAEASIPASLQRDWRA